MHFYDITQELFSCCVYPGDPSPEREILLSTAQGDICNLTALRMCAHNGTHIDAPFHFLEDGMTVDKIPPETFIGPAYVGSHEGELTAKDAESLLQKAKETYPESEQRILIKGKAVVTEEAAKVFASSGILLVGNESQTVGPEDSPMAVHLILLKMNIVLLEGIRLGAVDDGVYCLHAQPLLLNSADGAPCRAILSDLL